MGGDQTLSYFLVLWSVLRQLLIYADKLTLQFHAGMFMVLLYLHARKTIASCSFDMKPQKHDGCGFFLWIKIPRAFLGGNKVLEKYSLLLCVLYL